MTIQACAGCRERELGTDVAGGGRPAGSAHDWKRRLFVAIKAVLAVIPVAEFDKACEWYESFFGRAADTRPMDTLAEWHLSELGIVQVFLDPDRAGQTMVNFTVDDLDAAQSALSAQNIVTTDPQVVSSGRQRLTTTKDPDGNQLGLIESLV